jgi:hypothetical protein
LDGDQHAGRSLVIAHDPGFAPQIVRELCLSKHPDPPPSTGRKVTRGLVHTLAVRSEEIRGKLFEVEYPKPIRVASVASFNDLHAIFVKLSTWDPHGMTSPAFEAQYIHRGKIFAMFGRVCEACYVYHRFCDLWLVPMKRIL